MALAGRRDVEIDTLRGVAIVLMVAGHVIGWTSASGMRVADDSGWRYYDVLFEDLRMPLFAALSGFVYGLRPLARGGDFGALVRGKVRRLVVPLVVVGTTFLVVQRAIPGSNDALPWADTWTVWFYGVDHFWFLQAIFCIFVLVGLLDLVGLLSTARRLAAAVATSAVLSVGVIFWSTDLPARWDVFSFVDAFRLLPFFLLGYLFCAHGRTVTAPRRWLLGVTVVLFVVNATVVVGPLELLATERTVLGLLLGLAGVSTLMMYRPVLAWAPLARLGYFSFAIYLLHVFGTAAARIALERLGVDVPWIVFVGCLAAGLALPTVFEVTAGRVAWISWAMLGQRPYRSPWSSGSVSRSRSAGSPVPGTGRPTPSRSRRTVDARRRRR